MTTNRTQQEILERIAKIKDKDFFGFETNDLLEYLTFENAKLYLIETANREDWIGMGVKTPREIMIEYMPFAWEKANDCRGLSAARSMSHYKAWLWLDGDNELCESLSGYQYYGKDKLVKICEYLGIDSKEWDDGIRVNSESELER